MGYTIKKQAIMDVEEIGLKSITIGRACGDEKEPNAYYLVEKDNVPYLVVKVYYSWTYFEEAAIGLNYIVIGFEDVVYLIHSETFEMKTIKCSGYFGHVFSEEKVLWIASASQLIRIDERGEVMWKTKEIAVDGVIVHDFDGEYVHVSCELDPPGGWVSCLIDNETGDRVTVQEPWYFIESDGTLEKELNLEMSDNHILKGMGCSAIGRKDGSDEVLFYIGSGRERVAQVHLTWRGKKEESPTWPRTTIYPSWKAFMQQAVAGE